LLAIPLAIFNFGFFLPVINALSLGFRILSPAISVERYYF